MGPCRLAGLPISRLLGRYRDSIAAYASSITMRDPAQYGDEAVRIAEAGFAGYQGSSARDLAGAIAACRAARRAVGDDYVLMVDTSGGLDYSEALRLGRELRNMGYLWFEDPLPEDDIINSAQLRQKLSIPIMATEYSPGGFHAFAPWITNGATDYLRGDVAVKGGLTGIMKASVLADAFSHAVRNSPWRQLAEQHRPTACRNVYAEHDLFRDPAPGCCAEIRRDRRSRRRSPNGQVNAIDGPGLGVEVDMALIRRGTLEVLR